MPTGSGCIPFSPGRLGSDDLHVLLSAQGKQETMPMSGAAPPRLFGTDGIRGVAGEFPLEQTTVEIIGRALTDNLTVELGRAPSIVIGRDTRESGPRIARALWRGATAG